jgi:hypothetical protein
MTNTTVNRSCETRVDRTARDRVVPGILAWILAVCGVRAAADASQVEAVPVGAVWFATDFEGADLERGWQGELHWAADRSGGRCLAVRREETAGAGTTVVSRDLPVEPARGCLIRATAWVRAEGVTVRPRPWNGIKFMLAVETPRGRLWPQAEVPVGSFDWRRVTFTTRIPSDATAVRLVLGLEEVAGRAWFDDLNLVVAAPRRRPPDGRPERPFRGHDLPRLRGVMVSPDIDPEGLRVLGQEWGANLVRWQLVRHATPGTRPPLETYDAWLETELRKLDAALPWCARYGLYVVVDLHSPPGGRAIAGGYVAANDGLFADPRAQAKLVEVWERIARRYRGVPTIWGFDLVNEPVEEYVAEGCADWPGLAERVGRAIRAVDPGRTLIVEPADWGGPSGFVDWVPLSLDRVVYSVHMYEPHRFTHQGVYGEDPPVPYPGEIQGERWDRARLERALQPVRQFQQTYGMHIYAGEFSAIRWAPEGSAHRYLRDVIGIFESWGWDWSYHAFREWHGWSVEHGEDRADTRPAAQPTERQRLLQEWFGRNQKPRW